jgi:hypothetical protein
VRPSCEDRFIAKDRILRSLTGPGLKAICRRMIAIGTQHRLRRRTGIPVPVRDGWC